MSDNFASQLQMLGLRGKLNDSEIKKIGELNAEIFGHANNRQKIKHVTHLKEENLTLKKDVLKLTRNRDELKQKFEKLELEVQSYRAVGSTRNTSKFNWTGVNAPLLAPAAESTTIANEQRTAFSSAA